MRIQDRMITVNKLPADYRWMNAVEAENFGMGSEYPDAIYVRVGGTSESPWTDLAVPAALPEQEWIG